MTRSYDLFRRLGLYIAPGAVEAGLRERLLAAARTSRRRPATVAGDATTPHLVDAAQRRTKQLEMEPWAVEAANGVVETQRAAMIEHFAPTGIAGHLDDREPAQFLAYAPGDFFVTHADRDLAGANRRRISIVMFLNGETDAPEQGSYCGGALNIYAEMAGKPFHFPLMGDPGLLVAFRSETIHEVAPVTAGERYTIVSWLLGE
jgi:predicted 2-oxoglutarate/Fe(II)-dependent dioxygenase YbiX